MVWHLTQCPVSHGHCPNLGGWSGSKMPLMILYRVRCPWDKKNAGDKVPLIFLYQVRCPWKHLIAISASNLLPASDFTFSWLFLNQNFKPYPFIHINYNQWHSNVLKTPEIQWKLYLKVTQCYRIEENNAIVLGLSMPSAVFVISLVLVSLLKHS